MYEKIKRVKSHNGFALSFYAELPNFEKHKIVEMAYNHYLVNSICEQFSFKQR